MLITRPPLTLIKTGRKHLSRKNYNFLEEFRRLSTQNTPNISPTNSETGENENVNPLSISVESWTEKDEMILPESEDETLEAPLLLIEDRATQIKNRVLRQIQPDSRNRKSLENLENFREKTSKENEEKENQEIQLEAKQEAKPEETTPARKLQLRKVILDTRKRRWSPGRNAYVDLQKPGLPVWENPSEISAKKPKIESPPKSAPTENLVCQARKCKWCLPDSFVKPIPKHILKSHITGKTVKINPKSAPQCNDSGIYLVECKNCQAQILQKSSLEFRAVFSQRESNFKIFQDPTRPIPGSGGIGMFTHVKNCFAKVKGFENFGNQQALSKMEGNRRKKLEMGVYGMAEFIVIYLVEKIDVAKDVKFWGTRYNFWHKFFYGTENKSLNNVVRWPKGLEKNHKVQGEKQVLNISKKRKQDDRELEIEKDSEETTAAAAQVKKLNSEEILKQVADVQNSGRRFSERAIARKLSRL